MERIAVNISGTLFGYRKEGEKWEDAERRLTLEAELAVNNTGVLRLHMATAEGLFEGKYAMPKPDGTKETRDEAVKRVVDGTKEGI